MEAWDHIAPEWPPHAWRWFEQATGTSKKRYAELIAVERVREAAFAKWGLALEYVSLTFRRRRVFICVGFQDRVEQELEFVGPTICDAAWACIQALGGGE